jgi:hypothetical protein
MSSGASNHVDVHTATSNRDLSLMTRAGTPAAMAKSGTLLVATELAAMSAPHPSVTPFVTTA